MGERRKKEQKGLCLKIHGKALLKNGSDMFKNIYFIDRTNLITLWPPFTISKYFIVKCLHNREIQSYYHIYFYSFSLVFLVHFIQSLNRT